MDAAAILALATEAAGGDDWARARTLVLEGHAWFYPKGTHEPRVVADRYRMWRVFDPDRAFAHGPDGLVRIDAFAGGTVMFQVAWDGETTWSHQGRVDPAEAQAYWANAFGFGIIRHATKPGFQTARLPDDLVDGHPVWMVRVVDPGGGLTLFGVDQRSHAIRKAAFPTPKGWHERIYDDFERLTAPRWLQPRHVRLYYDGVKSNEVFWTRTAVNEPLDPGLFRLG